MKLPAIRINPLGMLVLIGCLLFFTFLNVSVWYKKHKKESTASLRHLLAVSISVAENGGAKVRDVRLGSNLEEKTKGKTKEGANDPLTAGDLLSHRTMVFSFEKTFPRVKVISEEHEDIPVQIDQELPAPQWDTISKVTDDIEIPTEDIVIWIDPLDATQEYTENLLDYVTTMVCVAVKGIPVIGVIHRPFANTTVWAWANHGISNLNVEDAKPKKDSEQVPHIIVSRSHAGKVGEVAKAAFGPKAEVTSAGGAGYKSLQVAMGKADAYIHVTLIKKWDICAGNVLLNALGGQMTSLSGHLIDYSISTDVSHNGGLLATLHNHEHYLEKLSSLKN